MIKKILRAVSYLEDEKEYLVSLQPHSKKTWKVQTNRMKSLKGNILSQLVALSKLSYHLRYEVCSYCGCVLNLTSGSEIDHVANQSRYPQFIFTELNLVLSCHFCNSPSKKGQKNTVNSQHNDYSQCQFKIVHPYLDDPDEHYDWLDESEGVIIQSKSEKGKESIKMFGLDDPIHTQHRAMVKKYQYYSLSPEDEADLQAAIERK